MFYNCLRGITLAALLHVTILASAQQKEIPKELYAAASIPDSLKENANSVVRFNEQVIVVKENGKQVIKEHSVVTILNEKGDGEATLEMGYNRRYDSYSNIEMRIYNEKGDLIKKYHKSDMYDGLVMNDETLVSDERFLAVKHDVVTYPVTVEIQYEEDESSYISLGRWSFQDNVEQAVQYATCKVTVNPAIGFRYKAENTSIKPVKETAEGLDTYTWKVVNVKPIKKEENVLLWKVLPRVLFASNSFNCYGYPGDFSSWTSFGKWIQSLNADVNSLTPDRVAALKKMTDTIKTDREKARFLYNYMQQNVRYVSVQLGIGGYKPFSATFVDQKKYGDCKALANYMHALLKAVDIKSYYAIIRAGTNAKAADLQFPTNEFNHAILCVPFKNDTTWLECTSNVQPFGMLGPFTENRNALLITEDGGKLVNTPRSTAHENQFSSEAHIILDADGGAKTHIKILSTGEYRDLYMNITRISADKQKEFLLRDLVIKQPSVFDFKPGQDLDNTKEIELDLEYDKFCDISSGDKMFYRPQAFSLWGNTVPIEDKRKADFYFDYPREKSCITTIDLPAGFEVETLPVSQTLKFAFGNYELKYFYDIVKNQVISTAKFNLNNQAIPAAKYTELQQYLDAVAKAQNKKLVIRHKA